MSANNIRKEEKVLSRSKSQLIKRLLGYLKPYKRKSAIVISLMILVMLCNLINPLLLGRAIDTYVADKNVNGLLIMGLFLCACNLAAWGFSKIRYILVAEVSNKILVEIRHQLYTHIQGLSFNFFDSRPVGKILARIMGDVNALQNLFTQSIQSLIPELLTLVGISCFMLALNVKLALGCLIILPFLIGAMFYIEVFSRRRWDAYRSKRSVMNAFTHEDFSGIKVVEAYAEEKQTAGNFKEIISELSSSFIHAVKLNDLFWPLVDISAGLGAVLVYMFGYRLVTSGEIQIGTLLAFSMYVGMFWNPIMNLCNFYNTLISNFSSS